LSIYPVPDRRVGAQLRDQITERGDAVDVDVTDALAVRSRAADAEAAGPDMHHQRLANPLDNDRTPVRAG
jgi:hypothetical protein